MKKSLILLATTALLANVAASSVVFATEGTEVPEVAAAVPEATPEVVETEVLAPEGAETVAEVKASETAGVTATDTEGPKVPEVEANAETEAGEAQAEPVEMASLEGEVAEVADPDSVETANVSVDAQKEGLKAQLIEIYNELVAKRAAGWKYPGDDGAMFDSTIKDVEITIGEYKDFDVHLLESIVGQLRDLIQSFEAPKPGETPKPEAPETPKPEAPKPEQPETPEAPKPGETPAPEAPKSALPNTGDAEATAKLKSMTMEKPVSTMPATQSDNKQLPQTGEADSFAIFSAAALTILAGVGMLAYGKREEV